MRWALLTLVLLLAVGGLLYSGGVAFVSTLSEATASLAVDAPATVGATTGWVEPPARSSPADPTAGSWMSGPESSLALQPAVPSNPEDAVQSQQRAFKSRKALETINSRELVR
jgi:hypothetical protein